MKRTAIGALFGSIFLAGAVAGAGAGAPRSAEAQDTAYRLEVGASDVISDASLILAVGLGADVEVGALALGVAIFGAPLVHELHDEGNAAGKSVVSRLAAVFLPPLVLWSLGGSECSEDDEECNDGWTWVVIACGAALLTAQVIDNFVWTPDAAR